MKTITTIAFAIVVMTLASCQKENFEPMNTRPPFTSIDTAWNEHVVEGEIWDLKIVGTYQVGGKQVTEVLTETSSTAVEKLEHYDYSTNTRVLIGRAIKFSNGTLLICQFGSDSTDKNNVLSTVENGQWKDHDFGVRNLKMDGEDYIVTVPGYNAGICRGPQRIEVTFICHRRGGASH